LHSHPFNAFKSAVGLAQDQGFSEHQLSMLFGGGSTAESVMAFYSWHTKHQAQLYS